MAHPYTIIKNRVSRGIAQVLEIQGSGATEAENTTIALCVGILQKAQAAVHNAIAISERANKAARPPRRERFLPPPVGVPAAAGDGEPDTLLDPMARPPAQPKGHWASATELAKGDDPSGIVDDATKF